jgi:hypothetical protein
VGPPALSWSHQRWPVDTALAHLKTTMQLAVLRGQTVAGVLQAWTIFALAYNLVRLVMGQAAILQHIGVQRLSCVDALRWLGPPSTGIPRSALRVNPIRPHRVAPRVTKRRPKPFPLMITPRHERRQPLLQPALSGYLQAIRPRAYIILQNSGIGGLALISA